jgi:hypothetical protein
MAGDLGGEPGELMLGLGAGQLVDRFGLGHDRQDG